MPRLFWASMDQVGIQLTETGGLRPALPSLGATARPRLVSGNAPPRTVVEEALRHEAGLSGAEAARRLQPDGPNELPSAKAQSCRHRAGGGARADVPAAGRCGGIYLMLGDLQEALMLLGFVFVVMGITLYQERKTERALEALRDLSSPRALVIRDGAAAAHRRARGRARRHRDRWPRATACRPTRCCCACDQPVGRRIAADRRIGAGAQDRAGDGGRADRPARRRRPAVRLLGHAGRAGPGRRRGRSPPARAPRSARSARRCRRSRPRRRCCRRRPAGWCAAWRWSGPAAVRRRGRGLRR